MTAPTRFTSPAEIRVARTVPPELVGVLQNLLWSHWEEPFNPEPVALLLDLHLEMIPGAENFKYIAAMRRLLADQANPRIRARYHVLSDDGRGNRWWEGQVEHDRHFRLWPATSLREARIRAAESSAFTVTVYQIRHAPPFMAPITP